MVRNQDDASFMSWTETLHPESAGATIDPRLQNQPPWVTVYHETCAGVDFENITVATHVVAVDEEMEANPQQPIETSRVSQQEEEHVNSPRNDQSGTSGVVTNSRPQPWKHSNLIDLIIGFSLTLGSFFSAIKIEFAAIIVYTFAAGSFYLAEEVFSHPASLLLKSIFMFVTSVLMFVDAILLTVSVLVTEILGGIAFLLCTIFGGPRSGTEWHQFIRRTCHLTRWGFRSCHQGWKPDRIFPLSMEDERGQLNPIPSDDEEVGMDDDEEAPSLAHHYNHGTYRDPTIPGSQFTGCDPPLYTHCAEESTVISSITFPADCTIDCPPIAIAPENVQVVHEDNEENYPHFVKNTQQVDMT